MRTRSGLRCKFKNRSRHVCMPTVQPQFVAVCVGWAHLRPAAVGRVGAAKPLGSPGEQSRSCQARGCRARSPEASCSSQQSAALLVLWRRCLDELQKLNSTAPPVSALGVRGSCAPWTGRIKSR